MNDKIVDLRFVPELVRFLRLETWVEYKDQWGDASIRRPTFETLRTNTSITMEHNKFGFAGLLTPHKEDGGRNFSRKIMVFVRTDVMVNENP